MARKAKLDGEQIAKELIGDFKADRKMVEELTVGFDEDTVKKARAMVTEKHQRKFMGVIAGMLK